MELCTYLDPSPTLLLSIARLIRSLSSTGSSTRKFFRDHSRFNLLLKPVRYDLIIEGNETELRT